MLVAHIVGLANAIGELSMVLAQLRQHVERRDVFRVVVQYALQTRDVANGAQRGSTELAHTLRNRVGCGIDLIGLLIEQQVIVAEVRPGDVPMGVLGLEIEREEIGEQRVERPRDISGRLRPKGGWRVRYSGGRGRACVLWVVALS